MTSHVQIYAPAGVYLWRISQYIEYFTPLTLCSPTSSPSQHYGVNLSLSSYRSWYPPEDTYGLACSVDRAGFRATDAFTVASLRMEPEQTTNLISG